MSLSNYKTSNPAFTGYFWDNDEDYDSKMTVRGIFFKSLVSIALIAIVTAYVWKLHEQAFDVSWFTYGGIIGSIIISVTISFKHHECTMMNQLSQ